MKVQYYTVLQSINQSIKLKHKVKEKKIVVFKLDTDQFFIPSTHEIKTMNAVLHIWSITMYQTCPKKKGQEYQGRKVMNENK